MLKSKRKLVTYPEYIKSRFDFMAAVNDGLDRNPCSHRGSREKALLDQMLDCPDCGVEVRAARDYFESITPFVDE